MSAIIEIQTIEGGRLDWVSVFRSSDDNAAIQWGERLLSGFSGFGRGSLKPNLRVTDANGKVIGAWQAEGYEAFASQLVTSQLRMGQVVTVTGVLDEMSLMNGYEDEREALLTNGEFRVGIHVYPNGVPEVQS